MYREYGIFHRLCRDKTLQLLTHSNWLLKGVARVAGSFFRALPRIPRTLRLLILGRRAIDISTLPAYQYLPLEGAREI